MDNHYHCPHCHSVLPKEPMVEKTANVGAVLGICWQCKILVLKRQFNTYPEVVRYDKLKELEAYGVRFVHKEDLES